MVRAIGQHALARGRFPPERGRLVERQDRAGLVDAHGEVADADVAEVIRQTPARAVDVVLHGGVDLNAEVVLRAPAAVCSDAARRALGGDLGHVQQQAADLDAAFRHALLEPLDLFGRAAP